MIFYFSGTGNSRYVAERLAVLLKDTAVSIAKHPCPTVPANDEVIGFVTPTYFWGIPWNVSDFVKNLHIEGRPYLFHVLTCGGSTGDASGMLEKHLGKAFDARFSVKMPDTWTPMFDVSDDRKNQALLDAAEESVDRIADIIAKKEKGDYDRLKGMGKLATRLVYPFYKRQSTRKFAVSSDCTGCGLCARQCPVNAIQIDNGKPSWTLAHCLFCLGCLHQCPQNAITFGPNTKKHGQYYNPRVKKG